MNILGLVGDEAIPNPGGGSLYRPKSKLMQKMEDKSKKTEEKLFSAPPVSGKLSVSASGGEISVQLVVTIV